MSQRTDASEAGAARGGSDQTSLRIENLTKRFGDEVAVDDLSIDVKLGTLKSLLGPSGCGKTTTLRCIAGLERPDSGRIYIDDELVTDPSDGVHVEPENRGIGMVFQSYAVWPHMTVEENVMYPLKIQKIGTKAERRQRVQDVLEAVGLEPYADNLATNLSGGQQQRVAISRALVVEPDILLFDEPLSNLDAKLRREMRMEIRRIYQEFNTTVLYVTHSQDEAMFLSDEIAIMRDGVIVEEGPPADLHSNPQTFFGMNFMGRCNTFEGTIADVDDDTATVETVIGPLRTSHGLDGQRNGDRVFACFRPKFCELLTEDQSPSDPSGVVVEGRLRMRAATRDFTEYEVEVGDHVVLVRTPEPLRIEAGDAVRFAIPEDDVRVFGYDRHESLLESDVVSTGEDETDTAGGEGIDASRDSTAVADAVE